MTKLKIEKAVSLFVISIFTLSGASATKSAEHPIKLSQAIDFLDNCYYTQNPSGYYTKGELRKDVRQAYDNGFRKIYFRGTGGVSYHESRVRPKFKGEPRRELAKKLVKTINEYDVVAEYVKVCHELGMELYYWIPIFDNSLSFSRNFPGMADYETFGPNPTADPNMKIEHMLAHRFADRPRERPERPIEKICMMISGNEIPDSITDKDLILYVGEYDKPFVRYTKPFSVELEPSVHGKIMKISGLSIDKPVVKFVSDVFTVSSRATSADALRAYYGDGVELKMYQSVEGTVWGDRDYECVQWGCGGVDFAWGKNGNSCIVRFGDFERYALGVPEYAYPECRQRLVNIVAEVFERYPDMDGVTFSIRTHSLPASGFKDEIGGGNFFYGFSEPIVKEYRKRYGIDPRKEPYDQKKFLKLRGEFITQMLDEVGTVVHKHGGKLEMMAPVDSKMFDGMRNPVVESRYAHGSMFPWWKDVSIDDFFDIKTWAKHGSVDLVLMLGTGYRQGEWNQKCRDEVARFRKCINGTKTRLGIHFLVDNSPSNGSEICKLLPAVLSEEGIDEVEFYEQNSMINYPAAYDETKKALEESGRLYEVLTKPPQMQRENSFGKTIQCGYDEGELESAKALVMRAKRTGYAGLSLVSGKNYAGGKDRFNSDGEMHDHDDCSMAFRTSERLNTRFSKSVKPVMLFGGIVWKKCPKAFMDSRKQFTHVSEVFVDTVYKSVFDGLLTKSYCIN